MPVKNEPVWKKKKKRNSPTTLELKMKSGGKQLAVILVTLTGRWSLGG